MRIKELTNAPQWLLDAVTRDEDVTIDESGRVQWHRGDFWGGDFRGGDFWGGDFRGGNFWGGNFLGGNFRGGNFRGGNFRGGDFWGGDFLGGNFRGGNFLGGDFLGGNFRGGNFLGGNFRGGDFLGGNFRGGDFRGGNFRGGDFWGEKIAHKPLSLYGLHWGVWISETRMAIGCQVHTHNDWAEFDDHAIAAMDRQALRFWRENKAFLLAMCAAHAARAASAFGGAGAADVLRGGV
jgi:uncharacterized protein YjbI with pentapeptide repeats